MFNKKEETLDTILGSFTTLKTKLTNFVADKKGVKADLEEKLTTTDADIEKASKALETTRKLLGE